MQILKPIIENKASKKIKIIFDKIKKASKINKIPNFWRTIANNPTT
tara:strand:+ start:292 stop:429 length:138 start_codon:yes stop_codon:yes gene_type:complete